MSLSMHAFQVLQSLYSLKQILIRILARAVQVHPIRHPRWPMFTPIRRHYLLGNPHFASIAS